MRVTRTIFVHPDCEALPLLNLFIISSIISSIQQVILSILIEQGNCSVSPPFFKMFLTWLTTKRTLPKRYRERYPGQERNEGTKERTRTNLRDQGRNKQTEPLHPLKHTHTIPYHTYKHQDVLNRVSSPTATDHRLTSPPRLPKPPEFFQFVAVERTTKEQEQSRAKILWRKTRQDELNDYSCYRYIITHFGLRVTTTTIHITVITKTNK